MSAEVGAYADKIVFEGFGLCLIFLKAAEQ